MFLDQDDRLATCLKERFSPFFAVYSTDPQFTDALADDLNLVNLYRVLFNTVFGTDLRLLRSRSFYTPWRRGGNSDTERQLISNRYHEGFARRDRAGLTLRRLQLKSQPAHAGRGVS